MHRRYRHSLAWASSFAFALAPGATLAQDEDDPMGGFDDDDDELEIEFDTSTTEEVDRWWNIDGSLVLSSSINWHAHRSAAGTNYKGLSRLRARLNLEFDADLPYDWKLRVSPHVWYDFAYLIHGFSRYTPQVLNDYEWEWDFQDTYLEGPLLHNVDLKIGRQVVNWGRSDTVRVLDVLNPLDQREPGRADIEDLALAVGMGKLDWYVDRKWTITAIAIPEIRFNDIPSFGSDFNPSPVPISKAPVPTPFTDWEAAASVRGIFEGWDISFHYAYIYDDLPHLRVVGFTPGVGPIFQQVHSRLHLAGAGGNYTFGSWLVKGEIAWLDGFEFLSVPDDFSRLDAMLGVEYYGIAENTFAIEVVERHLFDYNEMILATAFTREDSVEYTIRWTADWFNARLTTTVLAILLGYKVQDGVLLRAQGEYELYDGLSITAGILLYQAGELLPFSTWGRNDRAFIDIRYSF